MRLLAAAAAALLSISCGLDTSLDAKLPSTQTQALTTFASGSLIIPMDTTNQPTAILRAFGLVHRLLTNGIKVEWIADPGKTCTGSGTGINCTADFTATTQDFAGTTSSSNSYKGGPFVIDSADVAAATPFIDAFRTEDAALGLSVTVVHTATAPFSANVARTMQSAARIAVFEDGNEDIAFSYLNAARIPQSNGAVWPAAKCSSAGSPCAGAPDTVSESDIAGPTSGTGHDGILLDSSGNPNFCNLTSMHYSNQAKNVLQPEVIREVRQWLSASHTTHAFMECAAIDSFENGAAGHFLTTNGIANDTQPASPTDLIPSTPFMQFDGELISASGSINGIQLASGSTLRATDSVLSNDNGAATGRRIWWMTGFIDGDQTKGKVSYLAGHRYNLTTPIAGNTTNGVRLFLDSLFESPCTSFDDGAASLSVTASVSPATTNGNTFTYSFTIKNNGSGPATSVAMNASIPAGATVTASSITNGGTVVGTNVNWANLGTLAGGASITVSFAVTVTVDGNYSSSATATWKSFLTTLSVSSNTATGVRDTSVPHLAFLVQPQGTTAGATMAQVKVEVLDKNNNLVTTATNITLAVTNGAATLNGTTTVATTGGIATFSNLSINTAGTFTLAASATGDTGATSASFTISAAGLDHVVIAPKTASITAGSSQSYTLTAFDQFGNSRGDVTAASTFTATAGASCSAANCGGTTAGSFTITGTNGGKSDTATLTVTAAGFDHIAIAPATSTVSAGGTQTFTATAFDQFGNSLGDVTANTTFTASTGASCSGNVCGATAAGSYTITGDDGGAQATATLTIVAAGLDHVVIAPKNASVVSGNTQSYTLTSFDQFGNEIADVTASSTFSASAGASCTANACGSTGTGSFTITGQFSNKSDTATLAVTAAGLDHIVISPATATITAGGTQAYQAEGFDRFNNDLGDFTSGTAFSTTSPASCTGSTCTSNIAGTFTITGIAQGKTATATLTVTAAGLDHVVITPNPATITAGGTQAYQLVTADRFGNTIANVTGNGGTSFTGSVGVTCSANVCGSNISGAHTVTGTFSGKSATATLNVNPAAPDHIAFTQQPATDTAGDVQDITASVVDQFGNVETGDQTTSILFAITAGTGNPAGTLSCDATNNTATVKNGSATVSCSIDKTGTGYKLDATDQNTGTRAGTSTAFDITPSTLDRIVISPATATVDAASTQAYQVEGFDAFDNDIGSETANATFTASAGAVCVGNQCGSTIAGTYVITAQVGGTTDNATLTVTAAGLDHVVIAPKTSSIAAGSTQSYTLAAFDQFDNPRGDVTAQATFTGSLTATCAANACGSNTAGVFTITGSFNGASDTALLTVAGAGLASITIDPTSSTITAGGTQAYHVHAQDQFGNDLGDVTASATFTASGAAGCTQNVCGSNIASSTGFTVTANVQGHTATATLIVQPAAFDHVTIAPASSTIVANASQSYTLTSFDRFDNVIADVTTDPATTFTAGAGASCSGNVCTSTAAGAHSITGTFQGKSDTATLNVTAGSADHIAFTLQPQTQDAGALQTVNASVVDRFGNVITTDSTTQVQLAITNGTGAAGATLTCTSGGNPANNNTATVTNGTATLSCSIDKAGSGYTLDATDVAGALTQATSDPFDIDAAGFDHIALSPSTASVAAGDSQAFTATAFDAFGNEIGDVTANTTFDPGSTDASCTGNTCTSNIAASYTITGTFTATTTATATATLTVTPGAPVSIVITADGSGTVQAGGAQTFTVEGVDQFGNDTGPVTVTLTSDTTTTCTATSCTTTQAGTHTVTATTSDGLTATVTFTATPGAFDHIVVSPQDSATVAGQTVTYSVTSEDQFGNVIGDVTSQATFAPDAAVTCTDNTCSATAPGTHDVVVSFSGSDVTATITVQPAGLDHIVINPKTATVDVNVAQEFTVEGFDAFGNDLGDVSAGSTYTTTTGATCTVDASNKGSCTGTVAGTYTITATFFAATDTATLTVLGAGEGEGEGEGAGEGEGEGAGEGEGEGAGEGEGEGAGEGEGEGAGEGEGEGANCFGDDDQDGVKNCEDNCPKVPNPDQADADGNGIGDACDGAFAQLANGDLSVSGGGCHCGSTAPADAALGLALVALVGVRRRRHA